MAFTAGVANVLVVPSFAGFQRAVGQQVSRTMPAAGRTAGAAMAGGMATGLSGGSAAVSRAAGGVAAGASGAVSAAGTTASAGFMSRAAAGISRGATAVTGAVAGIGTRMSAGMAAAGTAAGAGFLGSMTRALGPLAAIMAPAAILGSGFGRFANIEDAEAKLSGLGHSAEVVEQTLENSLAAVEGTSFYLDQAMGTATTMLAAGIQPGQELQDILTLVGDAAYIAGTDFATMGSIFGQVAASNVVQGDTFNRLLDRSVPILQFLAAELGVTEAQVRELGSAGEISFADFAAAMESGLGGAATGGGRTVRNMLADTQAAIMVFGAGVVEWMRPGIETVTESLTEFFTWAGEKFDELTDWASDNSEWLTPVAVGASAVAVSMTAAAIATGAFRVAWSLLNTVMGKTPIGRIIFLVIGLVTALVTAWQTSGTFRDVVTGVWNAIWGVISTAVTWITETAVPWLTGAWESIKSGVSTVGDVIMGVWTDWIKPAWDAVAAAATWLWETVLKPVFDGIASAWDATGGWIFDVVSNVVLLAWDLMVFAIKAVWNNVLKPIFSNIGTAWDLLMIGIKAVWESYVKPAWDAMGLAIDALWTGYLKPAFDLIKLGWDAMVDGIVWVWNHTLGPLWETVADFVTETVVPGVERGLTMLDSAWRGLANMFREPINWVINFVWNDGLKAAFDAVAVAIGSEARLPEAPTIPQFAKGGLAQPGWALVGEEGPELVNFTSPGRVYTAGETQRMLGQGAPAGMFSESNPPHGAGFWDDVGGAWSRTWRGAVDTVQRGAAAAVDWVRGGLADAANFVLSPIFNGLGGLMSHWGSTGGLGADAMTNAKDRMVEWVRGEDDKAPKGVSGPVAKGGALRGAQAHVASNAQALANSVGGIQTMQAFNQSMAGGHPRGLAVDFIDRIGKLNQLADAIVSTGGFDRFNYMAWNRRLWSPGRGWRPQALGYGNDPFHTWHLHAEWYDQGGMLMPGMGMYANGTGAPEPVLTSTQWRDISTLAAKGATGPEYLVVRDIDGGLIGRMRVEADDRIRENDRRVEAWA